MYLMLDVVVNHLAATSASPDYTTAFKPFNTQTDFHPFCWITDYSNQTNVEQCWIGDRNLMLADLDTEDPQVVNMLNTWIKTLVANYTIDGIRIDTVKHVRQDFWPDFAKAAGVYTIGEVLDDRPSYLAPYTSSVVSCPGLKPS